MSTSCALALLSGSHALASSLRSLASAVYKITSFRDSARQPNCHGSALVLLSKQVERGRLQILITDGDGLTNRQQASHVDIMNMRQAGLMIFLLNNQLGMCIFVLV